MSEQKANVSRAVRSSSQEKIVNEKKNEKSIIYHENELPDANAKNSFFPIEKEKADIILNLFINHNNISELYDFFRKKKNEIDKLKEKDKKGLSILLPLYGLKSDIKEY